MSNQEIPTRDKMVDEDDNVRIPWILFFQGLTDGDPGNKWSPNIVNMTFSGTPTITGNYYVNSGFTDFWVLIIPNVNVSGTFGNTYIDLPFKVSVDTTCSVVSDVNPAIGVIKSSTRRAYLPTFTNITLPLSITGRVLSK